MVHTTDWDNTFEAEPTGARKIREGDDRIRELKVSVRERMELEHLFKDDQTNDGIHVWAHDITKTTGAITLLEHIMGVAGGNNLTIDPTGDAGKPYVIYKRDASANPVTITLDSGNWNNVATAGTTFITSITLARRGDYVAFFIDGTDAYITSIRRDGLRAIANATKTLDEFDDFITLNGTAGAATATLPTANQFEGKCFYIKAINIANTCKVAGTIDGVADHTFTLANEVISVFSNGTEWKYILGAPLTINTADIVDSAVTAAKIAAASINYLKFDTYIGMLFTSGAAINTNNTTSYVEAFRCAFYKTAELEKIAWFWQFFNDSTGTSSSYATIAGINTAVQTTIGAWGDESGILDISAASTGWHTAILYHKHSTGDTHDSNVRAFGGAYGGV